MCLDLWEKRSWVQVIQEVQDRFDRDEEEQIEENLQQGYKEELDE
jgi:hypothetical protein